MVMWVFRERLPGGLSRSATWLEVGDCSDSCQVQKDHEAGDSGSNEAAESGSNHSNAQVRSDVRITRL